jgi:hypothetical protein
MQPKNLEIAMYDKHKPIEDRTLVLVARPYTDIESGQKNWERERGSVTAAARRLAKNHPDLGFRITLHEPTPQAAWAANSFWLEHSRHMNECLIHRSVPTDQLKGPNGDGVKGIFGALSTLEELEKANTRAFGRYSNAAVIVTDPGTFSRYMRLWGWQHSTRPGAVATIRLSHTVAGGPSKQKLWNDFAEPRSINMQRVSIYEPG